MPTEAERLHRLRELYDQLHQDLWRYCARRVRPAEDAEDLLADVFTVVWGRLDDVPGPPGARAWIFAVARNHVRDRARRLVRRERLDVLAAIQEEQPTAPGVGPAEEPARVSALREALDQLSEADAEVLRLAVWDELSHREIAVVLKCRESAVAVRLHRARKRLARLMDATDPDPDPDPDLHPGPTLTPVRPPRRTAAALAEPCPRRLSVATHRLSGESS